MNKFDRVRRYLTFTASVFATALSACQTPRASTAEEPINVLVLADLDGIPGKQMSGAALLALDDLNARGGVLGRKLVPEVLNSGTDQGNVEENLARFEKAIAAKNYSVILGCVATRQTMSVINAAMKARLPFIGCAATSELNDPARFPYYFGQTVQYDRQAAGAAAIMKQFGIRSVDILAEESAQAEPFIKHYPEELARQGIAVNSIERFAPEQAREQADLWRKLDNSPSDYILVMGHDHHATQILQSAADARVTHRIIGDVSTGGSVSDEDVDPSLHKQTVFVSYSVFSRGVGTAGPSSTLKSMLPMFEKAAGAPLRLAPFWSAVAYDSVTIWASAASRANSLDAERIKEELESWAQDPPQDIRFLGYLRYLYSAQNHSNSISRSDFTIVQMGTFETAFKTRQALIVGK